METIKFGTPGINGGKLMKRTLLLSAASAVLLAATLGFGQGYIFLDNYASSGPPITYSPLTPDGLPRILADSSFTVGLYYALGDVRASIPADPTGFSIPGGPLVLGTGLGSTTSILPWPGTEGYFTAVYGFAVPGSYPGQTITVELIVYNGADYASSMLRSHTVPFVMPALANTAIPPSVVGDYMPVPEPAAFKIASLCLIFSLLFQRIKESWLGT